MVRVAINGYGRIGRVAHRIILDKHASEIDIVGINAGHSTDIKGWMYLLKYDTMYRPLQGHELSATPATEEQKKQGLIGMLTVDGKQIPVFSLKDPNMLPWGDLQVDVVLECTGKLVKEEDLKIHIARGAKGVVLSAPLKEGEVPTYVMSVNSQNYQGEKAVSNASCTTNCIAPVTQIIETHFGIEKAMMTTVHGYTSDQKLHDGGHKDYRRARAAAQNIIPTSTGATQALAKALPALNNIFTGLAIRVPVATGSLSDITYVVKKETSVEEVNNIFRQEAKNSQYRGIMEITEDPIVSSDVIGNAHSSIVDLSLTQVIGNLVKVVAWYDNEYGYTNRLVEEVLLVAHSF